MTDDRSKLTESEDKTFFKGIRILGIDMREEKAVFINLKKIFGIGTSTAKKICSIFSVNPLAKLKEIPSNVLNDMKNFIEKKTLIKKHEKFQESLLLGNELLQKLIDDLKSIPTESVRYYNLEKGYSLHGNSFNNGATAKKLRRFSDHKLGAKQ